MTLGRYRAFAETRIRPKLRIVFADIMQFQCFQSFRCSPIPVRLRRINRCFFLAELQCFPSPMCIIAHFVFCACRLDGIWRELAVSLIAAWSAFDGAPDKIPFRQDMPAMNRKRTGLSSIQSESAAGWRMRGAECALSCGRPSERRLRSWRWHGAHPKHGWAKEIRFSTPATGKQYCYRSRMNNGGSMAKSAHSTSKRIYAPECRAHIRTGTIARIIGQ